MKRDDGSIAFWMIAVGTACFLVPAVLALVVFPTAMIDTREVFAWGRFFPLATHKHPPMMALVAGLTEMALPANAFSAIIVGQAINAVAILYLYLALRLTVDAYRARLFTFLFATSLYFMLAPLSYALNADILQVPIWLAMVYHFVRAARTDAPVHWAALALWAAAAVMTKYAVALLFLAGGAAVLLTPEFRQVLRNPRFYLAILLGLVALIPHILALRANPTAIAYAENFAIGHRGFATRLDPLKNFVLGTVMFMAPGWVIIAVGFLNGNCRLDREPPAPDAASARRFFALVALALVVITIVLALVFSSTFNHRFGTPMFGLFALAAAPFVTVRPDIRAAADRGIVVTAALVAAVVFAASWIVYGVFTSHNYMQEPTVEASAIVRAEWDRHYSCGPGYILGDRASAHGFAITGDRHPVGVPLEDLHQASWFDPDLLAEEGAIVAFRTPVQEDAVAKALPDVTIGEVRSFTLPLIGTRSGATITYHYFFIPPASCAIATPDAPPEGPTAGPEARPQE